jgi:8-oxo-dGTP pyrophosphatase MutT (NUDIX family)
MKTRTEISAGGVAYRARENDGFDVAIVRTHEGRWQLPKGWVEAGESRESAAVREVREEAGIEGDVIGPIDSIEYWYKSTYDPEPARVHKYVHFFLVQATGGSTDDHDDEVLEARWTEIGEAQRMLAFKDEKRIVAMAETALDANKELARDAKEQSR